jgi:dTDP-4-dehydrorhamnose reductase
MAYTITAMQALPIGLSWLALFLNSVICPITVKPISTKDFAAPAPRPHYSVLENTLDPKARPWKEALAEVLNILKTA